MCLRKYLWQCFPNFCLCNPPDPQYFSSPPPSNEIHNFYFIKFLYTIFPFTQSLQNHYTYIYTLICKCFSCGNCTYLLFLHNVFLWENNSTTSIMYMMLWCWDFQLRVSSETKYKSHLNIKCELHFTITILKSKHYHDTA